MKNENITIYDIAAEAGVSSATVSRVLNGSGYVGEATRKKVEEIVAKYNFKPNVMAAGLKTQQTKVIGMLVPDIRNAYYSTIFVAIEEEAAKYDYNVILCNSSNILEKDTLYIEMLSRRKVDVVIELGGQMDRFKPEKAFRDMVTELTQKSLFFANGYIVNDRQLHVDVDDEPAMRKVIDKKLSEGKKTFAMIGGDPKIIASKLKYDLFTGILAEKHVAAKNRKLKKTGGYDMWDGEEGVRQLLSEGELPDVIFAINEMVAIGVIRQLDALQLKGSCEIVAFDNTFTAKTTNPTLTTIGPDYNEYAKQVMELIRAVVNDSKARRHGKIESVLVLGESCDV